MKILLLTKSTPWCHLVQEVLRKSEHEVTVVEGTPGNAEVSLFPGGKWDLIISYLCPWVLRPELLAMAPRAINFHPGGPSYPGFAPYSWAAYEADPAGMSLYDVVCHDMWPGVDSGPIVRRRNFYFSTADSVERLKHRAMRVMFAMFMEMFEENFADILEVAYWVRYPKTKKDFEVLRRIPADADKYEIERRIRACRYPGQPGAYFEGEEG